MRLVPSGPSENQCPLPGTTTGGPEQAERLWVPSLLTNSYTLICPACQGILAAKKASQGAVLNVFEPGGYRGARAFGQRPFEMIVRHCFFRRGGGGSLRVCLGRVKGGPGRDLPVSRMRSASLFCL